MKQLKIKNDFSGSGSQYIPKNPNPIAKIGSESEPILKGGFGKVWPWFGLSNAKEKKRN